MKEYLEFHEEYRKKYRNSVVLMQMGSFYEIYGVPPLHVGPDVYHFGEILNIQVARKNKKIEEISYKNPLFTGFPVCAYEDYRNILLNEGYTLIKVEQTTSPPNIEREVTEIISPGTSIDRYHTHDSNYLMSLYVQSYRSQGTHIIYVVGISAIDIGTGVNYAYSVSSTEHDPELWSDEVFRLLHNYQPREVLLHFDERVSLEIQTLCRKWNIPESIVHVNPLTDPHLRNVSYQNAYYRKIYKETGFLSPIEYLGFERNPEMTLSHLYMLEFIYQHKAENIQDIGAPLRLESDTHLALSYNSMYQLYLIDSHEHKAETFRSLLTFLNKCQTAIGRRLCKSRLLNPILCPETLRERYATIQHFHASFQGSRLYDALLPVLAKILDVQRYYRRMSLGLLHPYELSNLHKSHGHLGQLLALLREGYPTYYADYRPMVDSMETFLETLDSTFHIEELEKYSMDKMESSVFRTGRYPEIDEIQDNISRNYRKLQAFCDKLGFYIDAKKKDMVKQTYTDKYGHALQMTGPRSKTLIARLKNLSSDISFTCDNETHRFSVSECIASLQKRSGKDVFVLHPWVETVSRSIVSLERKMVAMNRETYLRELKMLYESFQGDSLFDHTVQCIGETDLYVCMAKTAIKEGYCCPRIEDRGSSRSYLDVREMRHPLVEKIQTDIAYIPNDISLSENGMLLYGTNACGKSTLMKALGLSLIMAQAGWFVPCSAFTFFPYTQIFTRILSNDNLFRGQSSFAVEMGELRNILQRAGPRSLVLGDELCSGTETESAIAIVAGGLQSLSRKKVSFVFTSHLHQLMEVSEVRELETLQVKHLRIHYDADTQTLIYDRKLEDGSGPASYGLEVCASMDMDPEFLSCAKRIHLALTNQSPNRVNPKPSAYNRGLYMDRCGIRECEHHAQETHHIKEQREADHDNMIDHHHKNIKHNLVPLCTQCHRKVTYGNLRIYGYRDTNQGPLLHYEYLSE